MAPPAERAVLITGASKGIGEACALHMHARGFRVYAGVRRPEDGEALRARAGTDRLRPVRLDVVDHDTIAAAAEGVDRDVGGAGLAGLVNNAGIAVAGPLEFLPPAELRHQLDVNVVGQVAVTQAMLPMLRRARGRVVFIGSVSGRSALPFTGAYAASKFALEAVADSLRVELLPFGIEVSIVEPGVIGTPIWETSIRRADEIQKEMPPQMQEYYGAQLSALRRRAERNMSGASPEVVADAVEHALTAERPRIRYVIGRDAKLRLLVERFIPTRRRDRMIASRLRKL